jgi:mono/diheme cytochrome c family protein
LKKLIQKISAEFNKNPGAVFGLLYPYVLVIIVVIGIIYVLNLNNVARQEVTPVPPDTTAVPQDLEVKKARTIPPVDVFKISQPSQELVQKGQQMFTTVCASCHGENGTGTGPASIGLNPAPRNFTKNESWKNGRTISEMYTTLQEGIPGSAMISYDFLTPEERFSLIQYIRVTFMQDPPLDSHDELAALDQTYNLSSGMELPAQIPVAAAMDIIIKENQGKLDKLNKLFELINNSGNSSADLFKDVTSDCKLALSALLNSNSWNANKNTFEHFVTINVNQNGFNGRVFNLTSGQWEVLYNYLSKNI